MFFKRGVIMPEKRNGVFGIIRNVFRHKKHSCSDIMYEAEGVISNYIGERKKEIIGKYRAKNGFLSVVMTGLVIAGLYFLFRILKN